MLCACLRISFQFSINRSVDRLLFFNYPTIWVTQKNRRRCSQCRYIWYLNNDDKTCYDCNLLLFHKIIISLLGSLMILCFSMKQVQTRHNLFYFISQIESTEKKRKPCFWIIESKERILYEEKKKKITLWHANHTIIIMFIMSGQN